MTWRLDLGDCRTAEIGDASVDVVITDPPYPREYVPLYGDLARLAARVLRPGGLCVAMCGQSYLFDVGAQMTPHLEYRWTGAYLTPGGQSAQIWARKVNTFWKPLLIFSKGPLVRWIGDVRRSEPNHNDKRFHHWGQSESGMVGIVEAYSAPGDLVLDPFAGAGTTGVACLRLGRRYHGIEIDPDHYRTALDRLRAEERGSTLAAARAGQLALWDVAPHVRRVKEVRR